jgi:hypothetical protein
MPKIDVTRSLRQSPKVPKAGAPAETKARAVPASGSEPAPGHIGGADVFNVAQTEMLQDTAPSSVALKVESQQINVLKGTAPELRQKPTGRSFNVVQLTDLHIGREQGDYGTPGFANDRPLPAGQDGASADAVRREVAWINAHKDSIDFVVVTGDLTSGAERSEFLKAKEILDQLEVPYVPMVGNHDIWPQTKKEKAATPDGTRVFMEVFAPVLERLKTQFPDWEEGPGPATSPQSTPFQDFTFTYKGVHMVCADLNSRHHAFPQAGAKPGVELSESWTWIKDHIRSRRQTHPDQPMMMFQHQPLTRFIPELADGSFTPGQYRAFVDFFDKGPGGDLPVIAAGHVHRNLLYGVGSLLPFGKQIGQGIETGAAYDGCLSVLTVTPTGK